MTGRRSAQVEEAEPRTVDEVAEVIRLRGGRMTVTRRRILDVLFSARSHLSAEDIFLAVQAAVPDMSAGTVYRNLEFLQTLGVVQHTHIDHGPLRYQIATGAHAHAVCERCGRTDNLPAEAVRVFAGDVGRALAFDVNVGHLSVHGLCADCRAMEPGR